MSGFEQPNYTQAPNAFFDKLLAEIDNLSELKVTLAVMRYTMGFHRDAHELSVGFLVEYTGLSRPSVVDGLKRAMTRGTVTRKESGNSFAYSLKVVKNLNQSDESASKESLPEVVKNLNPRKKEKESVEANASSGKPQTSGVVPTEKYVTDRIYEAMRDEGLRLPNGEYPYHLGRAKDMLAKDSPTDEERDTLPAAFVRLWKIKGRADAPAALMEMRRQKAREEILANNTRSDERINPQSDVAVAAKDKPRSVVWYSAFYQAPATSVEAWINEGLGHAEIMRRCEKGVA